MKGFLPISLLSKVLRKLSWFEELETLKSKTNFSNHNSYLEFSYLIPSKGSWTVFLFKFPAPTNFI